MSERYIEGLRDLFEAYNARDIERFIAHCDPSIELEAYTTSASARRLLRAPGRGKHSGVDVAMPVALVASWRDGLIVHAKAYAHREDALRSLGVTEGELHRIEP